MPHHQMPLFNTLSINSFLKQKKGHQAIQIHNISRPSNPLGLKCCGPCTMIASHKAAALCCSRDLSAGQDFKAPRARCGTSTVRPLELAISFKASSNLVRWHKITEFGTRKDVYNAVEQDQILQTCTCTGCLDVWIPGCLSPGHLHAHHFFIQTAAAPSLERKLAVAVDPQSQRAGEWNFPNRWGDLGIR